MNTEDREYGWDEKPISKPDEGGFVILPDGEYPFIVPLFERARHQGSEKLPPCNMAIVHLLVDGGEFGKCTVKHRLFLHSKMQGLLSQFFKGIGLRKKGDDLFMDWSKVPASTGIVKLGHRQYEGKTFQDVKGFVEPGQAAAPAPAPALIPVSTSAPPQSVAPSLPPADNLPF